MSKNKSVVYERSIATRNSFVVECIAAMMALSNEQKNGIQSECLNSLRGLLDKDDYKFIQLFSYKDVLGGNFLEFLYLNEEYDDLDRFIQELRLMDPIDFSFIMARDTIEKDFIRDIKSGKKTIEDAIRESIYLDEECFEHLEAFIFRPQEQLEKFINIMSKISGEVFSNIGDIEATYGKQLISVDKRFREKIPLDVSQEIMGKSFRRIFDFRKYVIIPSYYLPINSMRLFNDEYQILVFSIREEEMGISKEELGKALKVISDPTRIEIIKKISSKSFYGKELADMLKVKTPTVSHHLEQLKAVGLLNEERIRNIRYVSLNKNRYSEIMKALNGFID